MTFLTNGHSLSASQASTVLVVSELRDAIAAHGGLASVADLARRWGVSRQRVQQLTTHAAFPLPVYTSKGISVFIVSEADDFRRENIKGDGTKWPADLVERPTT